MRDLPRHVDHRGGDAQRDHRRRDDQSRPAKPAMEWKIAAFHEKNLRGHHAQPDRGRRAMKVQDQRRLRSLMEEAGKIGAKAEQRQGPDRQDPDREYTAIPLRRQPRSQTYASQYTPSPDGGESISP